MTEEVLVAPFDSLAPGLAYRIWALREAVFVVEQQAAYQELDERDLEPETRHLFIVGTDERPVAYLRLLDDGDLARIGRVVVAKDHRGRGLAGRLMRKALEIVGDRPSHLHAQSHLEQWYERFGYKRSGGDYLEDGISHTPMLRPGVGGEHGR